MIFNYVRLNKKNIIKRYVYLRQAYKSIDRALMSSWEDFSAYYSEAGKEVAEFIKEINCNFDKKIGLNDLEGKALSRVFRRTISMFLVRKSVFLLQSEWQFILQSSNEINKFLKNPITSDPISAKSNASASCFIIKKVYHPKMHIKLADQVDTFLHPSHLEKLSPYEIFLKCGVFESESK